MYIIFAYKNLLGKNFAIWVKSGKKVLTNSYVAVIMNV